MKNNLSKKPAFSFAEIAVVVFLFFAIGCMFLSKVFDISQKSEVIYRWRHTLSNAKYSYEVILLTEKKRLLDTLKLEREVRNKEILSMFKDTFNLDGIKSTTKKRSLKNYKYRFLNGLKVQKNTKYKQIIVGINWFNPGCIGTEDLCGVMLFDMNGIDPPNRFGLDVFGVNIYDNRLEPFGTGLSYGQNEKNCRRLETGVTCSKFYLMGGQFFK